MPGYHKTPQSSIVLSIDIGQGLAVLNPPAREQGSNNVMPGQQGEFLLSVEDANIFVVSGYQGNEHLSYVCVQVHNASVSHCGEYQKNIPSFNYFQDILPKFL